MQAINNRINTQLGLTVLGAVTLMYPHDPKAPASETINCGCTMLPWKEAWGDVAKGGAMATPGRKYDAGPTMNQVLAATPELPANFRSGGKRRAAASATLADTTLAKLDGDAHAYVLGNGRRSGHEYLYAFDADSGKVLAQRTDGRADGVAMPPELKAAALDRTRHLVIHHNHPDSSPPSAADVVSLARYPGIAGIAVYEHDGSLWRVAALERGNIEKAVAAS